MTVDFKWYILNTVSGVELQVKRDIEEQITLKGRWDDIEEIKVLEVDRQQTSKKGKVTVRSKSLLLGYIIIKMRMLPEVKDLILSVPRVGSFLGVKNNPTSLSDKEVENFCSRVKSQYDSIMQSSSYKIGDRVRVVDGPFAEFLGVVEYVDNSSSKLKISVLIFNKSTEIELGFDQVKFCN